MKSRSGFLLVEVLLALLVLAVAFVAFLGAMAQALRVSSRSGRTMEAVSKMEELLFGIQNGLRPDLAGYGGEGLLGNDYRYHFKDLEVGETGVWLEGRLSWKDRSLLEARLFVSKAAVE